MGRGRVGKENGKRNWRRKKCARFLCNLFSCVCFALRISGTFSGDLCWGFEVLVVLRNETGRKVGLNGSRRGRDEVEERRGRNRRLEQPVIEIESEIYSATEL